MPGVAPGPSTRWSGPRLKTLAVSAGFTEQEAVIAAAIALAESGGNPTAKNPGSNARGLWQIMTTAHGDKIAGRNIFDPAVNADVARKVYVEAGKKWTPWAVYNSGAYKKHLPSAAGTAADPVTGLGDKIAEAVPDNPVAGALGRFGGQLEKWLSIAIAAQVALALILLGVVLLIAPGVITKARKKVPALKVLS
jgi:hypothetical protein